MDSRIEELKAQRAALDEEIKKLERRNYIQVGNVSADLEKNIVYIQMWYRKHGILKIASSNEMRSGFYSSKDDLDIQIQNLIKNLQEVLRFIKDAKEEANAPTN